MNLLSPHTVYFAKITCNNQTDINMLHSTIKQHIASSNIVSFAQGMVWYSVINLLHIAIAVVPSKAATRVLKRIISLVIK